jgi:hypothetical protein
VQSFEDDRKEAPTLEVNLGSNTAMSSTLSFFRSYASSDFSLAVYVVVLNALKSKGRAVNQIMCKVFVMVCPSSSRNYIATVTVGGPNRPTAYSYRQDTQCSLETIQQIYQASQLARQNFIRQSGW